MNNDSKGKVRPPAAVILMTRTDMTPSSYTKNCENSSTAASWTALVLRQRHGSRRTRVRRKSVRTSSQTTIVRRG